MCFQVYSIFDRVVREYSPTPIFVHNLEDCKRRVAAAYNGNPFVKDLQLYRIGTYDTLTGYIGFDSNVPDFICDLSELYEVKVNGEA
ncbi:nonstructural protein [Dipodfec virus UOA04_Rod_1094]|nr:nonstructural protein [Dipodfec virus UOA04_Rod_1094]